MIGIQVETEILEAIDETGKVILYDDKGNEITLTVEK